MSNSPWSSRPPSRWALLHCSKSSFMIIFRANTCLVLTVLYSGLNLCVCSSSESPLQMRVTYDFKARNNQELNVFKGEVVEVRKQKYKNHLCFCLSEDCLLHYINLACVFFWNFKHLQVFERSILYNIEMIGIFPHLKRWNTRVWLLRKVDKRNVSASKSSHHNMN